MGPFEVLANGEIGAADARMLVRHCVAMMRRENLPQDQNPARHLAFALWEKHSGALDFLMDNRPEGGAWALLKKLRDHPERLVEKLECPRIKHYEVASDAWEGVFLSRSDWAGFCGDTKPLFGVVIDAANDETIRLRWMIGYGDPRFNGEQNNKNKHNIHGALNAGLSGSAKPALNRGRTRILVKTIDIDQFSSPPESEGIIGDFAVIAREFIVRRAELFTPDFQNSNLPLPQS